MVTWTWMLVEGLKTLKNVEDYQDDGYLDTMAWMALDGLKGL